MAKLYAEITSDKGGRMVGKGGNSTIETTYRVGNSKHVTVFVTHSSIIIRDDITGARMAYHPDRLQ